MEQLIDRVLSYESSKQKWRSDHASIEFQEASELNKMLYGIPLNRSTNCRCIEDLFFMLHRKKTKLIQNKIMKTSNERYLLKATAVVMNHAFASPLTRETASEEDCKKLLRLNPANARHFDVLPENWESEINGKKPAKAAKEGTDKKPAKAAKEGTDKKEELPEDALEARYNLRKEKLEGLGYQLKLDEDGEPSHFVIDEDDNFSISYSDVVNLSDDEIELLIGE